MELIDYKPRRRRTTAVIVLSQRHCINFGHLVGSSQTSNASFKILSSLNLQLVTQIIKIMKFSVASFFTLVTLLCHALAASVQYVRLLSSSANLGIKLTTYIFRRWARCRSILIYGQETTLAQLLPFAYTQGRGLTLTYLPRQSY